MRERGRERGRREEKEAFGDAQNLKLVCIIRLSRVSVKLLWWVVGAFFTYININNMSVLFFLNNCQALMKNMFLKNVVPSMYPFVILETGLNSRKDQSFARVEMMTL